MLKEELKAKKKAWREAHKEEIKLYKKKWREAHKEEIKSYQKAYIKSYQKAYIKSYQKDYYKVHKQELNNKYKSYYQEHKEERKIYLKSDLNSLGQTKKNIRGKSWRYLSKYGTKLQGYEIHHCFTYDDPTKFIYCSKEIHLKIHQYLRDNSIDADSNHYEQIKHLLDEKVIIFK